MVMNVINVKYVSNIMSLKCSTIKETFICEWNLLSTHTCSQTPASQTEQESEEENVSGA